MKKALFLTSIFIIFIVSSSIAKTDFEIIPQTTDVVFKTNSSFNLLVTIVNNQLFDDVFTISFFPPIKGVSITPERTSIKVSARSQTTISILFSAPLSAGEILPSYLTISITSTTTGKTSSVPIIVRVIKSSPIYIASAVVDNYVVDPGESIKITTKVVNIDKQTYEGGVLEFKVKKGIQTISQFSEEIEAISSSSSINVEKTYTFDKYAENGTYVIVVYLKGSHGKVLDSKTISGIRVKELKVSPLRTAKKTVKYTITGINVEIVLKNDGNVNTAPFYLTESIPSYLSTFFTTTKEPDMVKTVGNNLVYYWHVESLSPGQEEVISYKLFLLPVWVSGVLAISLIYLAVRWSFSVRLSKKHIGIPRKEKEIKIVLEIKNKTNKTLRNVYIRDFVPPLAKVLNKFDTVKPKIRKTKDHIELVWRIRTLKPKEERIFTYYIAPIVDIIGKLKLPEAVISYREDKKIKTIKSSKLKLKSE